MAYIVSWKHSYKFTSLCLVHLIIYTLKPMSWILISSGRFSEGFSEGKTYFTLALQLLACSSWDSQLQPSPQLFSPAPYLQWPSSLSPQCQTHSFHNVHPSRIWMQLRNEYSLKVLLPLSKQIPFPQSPTWCPVIQSTLLCSPRISSSTKFSQLPGSVAFDSLKPIQAASFAHCSNTSI